jgi:AbrB family looped-hinge helix DNA binding protein
VERDMPKAKVTSKGQITIPLRVRCDLALKLGDEVEFVEERGIYHLRKVVPQDFLKEWVGYLKEYVGCDTDTLIAEMRGE